MTTEPTTMTRSRSPHWEKVADWADTLEDALLPSSARITGRALVRHFNNHGTPAERPYRDWFIREVQQNPEFMPMKGESLRRSAEHVIAAGLSGLTRTGFLEVHGERVSISEPQRWNRGRGPTQLRSRIA